MGTEKCQNQLFGAIFCLKMKQQIKLLNHFVYVVTKEKKILGLVEQTILNQMIKLM